MIREKILKESSSREKKHIMYRGNRNKMTMAFWSETVQVRRHWSNIFYVLKETMTTKNPVKLSFIQAGYLLDTKGNRLFWT